MITLFEVMYLLKSRGGYENSKNYSKYFIINSLTSNHRYIFIPAQTVLGQENPISKLSTKQTIIKDCKLIEKIIDELITLDIPKEFMSDLDILFQIINNFTLQEILNDILNFILPKIHQLIKKNLLQKQKLKIEVGVMGKKQGRFN